MKEQKIRNKTLAVCGGERLHTTNWGTAMRNSMRQENTTASHVHLEFI